MIVDLAAERGGNCELTKAGQTVLQGGVTILGPTDLPAEEPHHASQLYSKNITTFLLYLVKEGRLTLDAEDEVVRETLVARGGEVVQPLASSNCSRRRDLFCTLPEVIHAHAA